MIFLFIVGGGCRLSDTELNKIDATKGRKSSRAKLELSRLRSFDILGGDWVVVSGVFIFGQFIIVKKKMAPAQILA